MEGDREKGGEETDKRTIEAGNRPNRTGIPEQHTDQIQRQREPWSPTQQSDHDQRGRDRWVKQTTGQRSRSPPPLRQGRRGEKALNGKSENQSTCTPSNVRVLYFNANSIINKMQEFEVIVTENNPDIVCICEAWTKEDIENSYLNINDYSLVSRTDRSDTKKGIGGGLLIYAKN